jgi:predicted dehydrogenase
MSRIVVIGAGQHSRRNHLPALKKYASLRPDQVELTALCDLRRDHVEAVYQEYGFKTFYTDIDEMLATECPDGCIAITPISETKRIASQIISAGIPLLMEKPVGATLEEAKEICALVRKEKARVMVSMNRRFSPALSAARSFISDRPLAYIHGQMLRHARIEPEFFFGTAIHAIDAMRHIAGDVRDHVVTTRRVDGVTWYTVQLAFESGATGTLDVMPNCGCVSETYQMFGPGYRVLAEVTEGSDPKAVLWECGQISQSDAPTTGMPDFVQNGSYNETIEFISSLNDNRDPRPSPADVLQSVELCQCIQEDIDLI